MTYLAGLNFPGQQRSPAIHCDAAGCGAVIRIDGPPPQWFLANKPKRGWTLIREPGEKRLDFCPNCRPPSAKWVRFIVEMRAALSAQTSRAIAAESRANAAERELARMKAAVGEHLADWQTSHNMHWDREGTSGTNCPACIEDRKLRGALRAMAYGAPPPEPATGDDG